jgi:hypothetical protein
MKQIDITEELRILLSEDYIVKNKETGNVYSVKHINSKKHVAVDTDESGKPVNRSEEEADDKSRELQSKVPDIKKADSKAADKKARAEAEAKAIKAATDNPKGEIDYMKKAILEDKSNPFHFDIKELSTKMNKVSDTEQVSTESAKKIKENGDLIIQAVKSNNSLNDEDIENLTNVNNLLTTSAIGSGFSESAVNDMMVDSLTKMLFQENESRKHQLGDHGIRHIYGDMKYTNEALVKLDEYVKTTPRQKYLTQVMLAIHDLGYSTSVMREPGMSITASNSHKDVSAILTDYELNSGPWSKLNLTDDEKKLVDYAIRTHDDMNLDFENQPVVSAIRLSDNMAVFKKEKIPYVFKMFGEKKSEKILLDIKTINAKSNSIESNLTKKYLNKEISGIKYNNSIEKLHNAVTQKQNKLKDDLHKEVDKSDYKDYEKTYLNDAIDEITLYTAKATLGMWAGEIREKDGIDFDKNGEKIRANVYLQQNKFNTLLSDAGLDLGNDKFLKLANSFGIEKPEYPKQMKQADLDKLSPKEREDIVAKQFEAMDSYFKSLDNYENKLDKGELANDSIKIKVENVNESFKKLYPILREEILKSMGLPITHTLSFNNAQTLLNSKSIFNKYDIQTSVLSNNKLVVKGNVHMINKIIDKIKPYLV